MPSLHIFMKHSKSRKIFLTLKALTAQGTQRGIFLDGINRIYKKMNHEVIKNTKGMAVLAVLSHLADTAFGLWVIDPARNMFLCQPCKPSPCKLSLAQNRGEEAD